MMMMILVLTSELFTSLRHAANTALKHLNTASNTERVKVFKFKY